MAGSKGRQNWTVSFCHQKEEMDSVLAAPLRDEGRGREGEQEGGEDDRGDQRRSE